MSKLRKKTFAEFKSMEMRQQWIKLINDIALAVNGEIGPEAIWAIDKTRLLYELALQWHGYNKGALDCDKKHDPFRHQKNLD